MKPELLMIGPLLSHVHQAAVVAAFVASAAVVADGLRRPTASSR